MVLDQEAAAGPLTRSALVSLMHEAQGKPVISGLLSLGLAQSGDHGFRFRQGHGILGA